jgi:L-alanine-DL-glutamate epimerase-like enolase superfamily enzyme
MNNPADIQIIGAELHVLPVKTRMPIKFGTEVVTWVNVARARVMVAGRDGRRTTGWGETPLSAQWAWPGGLSHMERDRRMREFCGWLARDLVKQNQWGHPMELGADFQKHRLDALLNQFNQSNTDQPMPHLAALVCLSAFDLAVHDAYGNHLNRPTYLTYDRTHMNRDLGDYLEPRDVFAGKYPEDFLVRNPPKSLVAWHLVGGLDPLSEADGGRPDESDGQPVWLSQWIARDRLKALKIKLRGNDSAWDYQRIVDVGKMAIEWDVNWLSADFNCTVREPDYVNDILDRLRDESPNIYGILLYVEQPFAYDLAANPIDVHAVASRKPLFMDESAHNWELVRMGRSLGWSGVALKTCKTQTGAILSLCWAKAHGMALMVQDLANPMLAMIPHALLAAHAGTIMGVETNASQFYPAASEAEAVIHPGLYRRRGGKVNWETVGGTGFGYRVEEIGRSLPEPAIVCGEMD